MSNTGAGQKHTGKKVLLGIAGCAMVPVGFFLMIWLTFSAPIVMEEYRNRIPFDSAGWKADKPSGIENWPTRLRMEHDLLHSGRLKGLTQEQVIELLGKPTRQDSDYMRYVTGPEINFIRIDSRILFIRFGPDGKARTWGAYNS